VARYLSTDRDFVYRNARELDGCKLGLGPKAPWRFELALVDEALERFTCSTGGLRPGVPVRGRGVPVVVVLPQFARMA